MDEPRQHAKGLVRVQRNAGVPHAVNTEEKRAAEPAKLVGTVTTGAVSAVKDKISAGRAGIQSG